MKPIRSVRKLALGAAVLFAAGTAFAQMPGADMNVAIVKLFGNLTAFSAVSDVKILDQSQKELIRMPMTFAVLDDKIRVDVDYARIKSAALAPNAVAHLKQFGMDRLASIARPDRKAMYIVYPGARSYVNMPMSQADATAAGQGLKIEKTPLGKETLDGRACVKNRTVIKDTKGATLLDATTWNAADLKDFPVQIATKENGNTIIMQFRDIKFARPDPRQFEPPAGYAAYPDPQALKTAAAKKLPPGEPAKK